METALVRLDEEEKAYTIEEIYTAPRKRATITLSSILVDLLRELQNNIRDPKSNVPIAFSDLVEDMVLYVFAYAQDDFLHKFYEEAED